LAAHLLFTTAVEAVDPVAGEGLILWKEGRCDVVDPAMLGAAVDAYLCTAGLPAEVARARIAKLQETASILGPGVPTPESMGRAYILLQALAADPLDEGRCAELMTAITRISKVFSRQKSPPASEAALNRQREILSWNIAVEKKYAEMVNAPSFSSKPKQNSKPAPPSADEQRLSEVMNEIRRMELGGEVSELQVRLELQDLAVRFLTRGDYAESILAVRFYRGLFADRNPALRLDPQEKLRISPPDSSPTLGTVETLATEMLGNIRQGLSGTLVLLQSQSLVGASRSLTGAFALGSRTLEVRSFPTEVREKILLQMRGERTLQELLARKDYDAANQELAKLEQQSSDFNAKDYRVTIETGKSLSAVHLAGARKAGSAGDYDAMIRELKLSTDCWPRNPEIAPVVDEFQKSARIQQAVIEEFDLLYRSRKVREILKGRDRFEFALASMPSRHAELMGAIEEARAIKEGAERARELHDFGSTVAAWELSERLFRRYPGQEELKDLRAAMRPDVEALAEGLENAGQLEQSQPASSLARYLLLKRSYPQSELVSEGITRQSRRLLEGASSAGA
jgi:hypothetical protein